MLRAVRDIGLNFIELQFSSVDRDSSVGKVINLAISREASPLSVGQVVIAFGKLKQIQSFHIKLNN
jgi:hypothetical protein